MTTCTRCNVGDWHPCARLCTLADCELRQPHALPAASTGHAGRLFPGGVEVAAGGFVIDQGGTAYRGQGAGSSPLPTSQPRASCAANDVPSGGVADTPIHGGRHAA